MIQWKEDELDRKTKPLLLAGHEIDARPFTGPTSLKDLAAHPPAVLIIDLDRSPSQGRDLAVAMKHRAATRAIPLVMAGGDPKKVARIVELLPNLTYCEWSRVRGAVRKAIKQDQSADPPDSVFAAYKGRPLPAKLGIKPKDRVALLSPPAGFKKILGKLPPGAKLAGQAGGPFSVVLLFVRTRGVFDKRFAVAARACEKRGRLWIVWPKKSSDLAGDLDQKIVRAQGLEAGWVDFKIVSVDSTWTGLCFVRRK